MLYSYLCFCMLATHVVTNLFSDNFNDQIVDTIHTISSKALLNNNKSPDVLAEAINLNSHASADKAIVKKRNSAICRPRSFQGEQPKDDLTGLVEKYHDTVNLWWRWREINKLPPGKGEMEIYQNSNEPLISSDEPTMCDKYKTKKNHVTCAGKEYDNADPENIRYVLNCARGSCKLFQSLFDRLQTLKSKITFRDEETNAPAKRIQNPGTQRSSILL